MEQRDLQGYLTFFGFAISVLAVFYFAIEFLPEVSQWTQLAALVLLAVCFAFLGVYLRHTAVGEPFFPGPNMRWLRPPVVLYLMALIAGVAAEIRFLAIDDVDRAIKIFASLVIGLALIFWASRWRKKEEEGDEPPVADESA